MSSRYDRRMSWRVLRAYALLSASVCRSRSARCDVGIFAHLLVRVGDGLGDGGVIPQGGQPELGDTRDGRVLLSLLDLGDLGSLLILLVLLVRVGRLALLNFLVGRLELAGDDGGTALVQGLVLDEELMIRQYVVRRIAPYMMAWQMSQVSLKPEQGCWRWRSRRGLVDHLPSSRARGWPSGTRSQSWHARPARP